MSVTQSSVLLGEGSSHLWGGGGGGEGGLSVLYSLVMFSSSSHSPALHIGEGPGGHAPGLAYHHQQRMLRLCPLTLH